MSCLVTAQERRVDLWSLFLPAVGFRTVQSGLYTLTSAQPGWALSAVNDVPDVSKSERRGSAKEAGRVWLSAVS